jgi:HlyD family secretion protein
MSGRARAALFVLLALVLSVSACNKQDDSWQGWVEANLIFVAPDEVGRVRTLAVREGASVAAGEELFTVDDDLQQADVAQNQALVENAKLALERARALVKTSAGTQKALDDAEAALRTAQARLNSAQTRLARRKVASPVAGIVQQVYFRPGEMVPAGRPVLALLPPGNVKVRFFVPEAVLPHIAYDDRVKIACDGCTPELTARVSFIAKQAEYTPPVIYSLEERAKLVFLIEALPDKPDNLRVGQPVDVRLIAPAPPPETAK